MQVGVRSGMRKAALVMALASGLGLQACSPVYRNHGYTPPEEDLAQIEVGKSTREDVTAAVGRPSSMGLLEGSGWYYVSSRWKHLGWKAPEEIDREVVVVTFSDRGLVENVERFGLERGEVVALSRRVTEQNVKGIGLVRQLLGSIGRVSAGQINDN